ncbi:MAG: hypothetical protein OEY80_08120 [Nitrospirota bacterium]|nr:hypothetical protein [Nitrospirota bacterium]
MWRYIVMVVGLVVGVLGSACSFDGTPQRLPAYLTPVPATGEAAAASHALPNGEITGALVVINDSGFPKSAPGLQQGTLRNLGGHLQAEIHKQLPIQLSSVLYPAGLQPNGSADQFIELAKDQNVPYLLLAILSSSEWEVSDRLPLGGLQQGGLRGGGLVGYRAENYARVELALIDGQTGRPVVTTDGQAWATLERLAVPLESNVYPVVRREQSQPPIYPNSEGEAFETLRWVSGKDAIAQAVMHLEEVWKKSSG